MCTSPSTFPQNSRWKVCSKTSLLSMPQSLEGIQLDPSSLPPPTQVSHSPYSSSSLPPPILSLSQPPLSATPI